jgi:hypothetical protein
MSYFLCIAADPQDRAACSAVLKRCADESIYAIFNPDERDRLHQIMTGDIIILNCQNRFVAWGKVQGSAQDENITISAVDYICKIQIKKWHWHNDDKKDEGIDAKDRVKGMMKYPVEGTSLRDVIKELLCCKAKSLCEEIKRIM